MVGTTLQQQLSDHFSLCGVEMNGTDINAGHYTHANACQGASVLLSNELAPAQKQFSINQSPTSNTLVTCTQTQQRVLLAQLPQTQLTAPSPEPTPGCYPTIYALHLVGTPNQKDMTAQ